MTQDQWTAVENYFVGALAPPDPALDSALKATEAGGLPAISVAPNEGKQLHRLARALPDGGRLVSLEVDPHHAEVARANLANAGLAGVAEVVVGPALQSLPDLVGPFDLVFIDADKQSNADYFMHALRLSRPGTVIVVDNVVRDGAVIDASSDNAAVQGVRRLVDLVAAEPRVSATVIQTVGSKGYDGYLLAV